MAISNAIYDIIYDGTFKTTQSRAFMIKPGEVGVVRGTGFKRFKTHPDNTQTRVHDVACLQWLLYEDGGLPESVECSGHIIDFSKYKGRLIAAENLSINGCNYALEMCNNVMMIDIPGQYRFVLNDESSIGSVRIFLNVYGKEEFPRSSGMFVGALG